jgi:O-antigen/teichoic acid export membrane protein
MNSSRMIRNVLANWGGFALAAVVNFFLAPFVVRHLGETLYGISVLFLALTGYIGMLDLIVRGGLTPCVARFHARGEHAQSSQAASAAVVMFGGLGLLVSAVCFFIALRVELLPIPAADHDLARILFLLAGPNVTVSLLSGVFTGTLMGLQRFELVNSISVAATAVRAAAIVWALSAGGGIVALVWVQLLTTLGALLACAWACFRVYPELNVRLRKPDRASALMLLSLSAYALLLVVFDWLLAYLVSLLVGALATAAMVTSFWIAANLIHYSRIIVGGISRTATPLAGALEAQGDTARLQRTALLATTLASMVVLPVAATFILRGGSFIALWMGSQFREPAGTVLAILTIGLAFSASSQIALATALGIDMHRPVARVSVLQGLATLIAAAILLERAGLPGVAWAVAVPYLAVSLFFWPVYVRRIIGIPIASFFHAAWTRPFAASVPFAAATYALEQFWPANNLALFFFQVGLILPLAALGGWLVCLTSADRAILTDSIRLRGE